jgi:alkanesulfonate monooxygenase SsuD/methylene tetrahydromethanopterin reductase-like flavin-dependent oxidoreductase (luciferase family)
MLSWIAASTSRLRLATRVLGLPYRPPAVVAKMAETFARLSGGRLILGLGAGSSEEEFRALGLEGRPLRDRFDGLEEAIRIIRGLWSEQRYSFEGRLYRTDEAQLEPKPDRPIPIWLGTHGKRGLDLTGRLADGWIPSLASAPPDRVPAMRQRMLEAARDAGRDPAEISCIYNLEVRVGEPRGARPFLISGNPEVMADRLLGLLRLGFSGLNFIAVGPETEEQVERLAREVIPAVRATL